MASPANMAMVSRAIGGSGLNGGMAQHESTSWKNPSPPHMSRVSTPSMSKAERLLGVSDTSSGGGGGNGGGAGHVHGVDAACPVHGHAAGRHKPPRRSRGFTSAIAEIKGALSGATRMAAARGRRTPSSPAFLNGTDSESATSAASPTVNNSASTSTVPVYAEPTPRPVHVEPQAMPSHADRSPLASYVEPSSPYRSHRGSDSPSSPMDHEMLLDYHAALTSTQHKGAKGLPSISENLGGPREAINGRSAAQPAGANPLSQPLFPKMGSSHVPLDRIRSPPAISGTSETTATGRIFSRRGKRRTSREADMEDPLTPPVDRQRPGVHMPLPPMPANRGDSSAIEQWLARADLERRPSTTSTATRSTVALARQRPGPSFSPTESSFSTSTITTSKDTTNLPRHHPPPIPKLRTVKSTDELDTFAVARQQPPAGGKGGRNLMQESMLSLSSSDEESDGEGPFSRPVRTEVERTMHVRPSPTNQHSTKSFAAQPKNAPEFLEMQRQVIQQQNSQKNAVKGRARQIAIPPQPGASRSPFDNVDWDEDQADRSAHQLRIVTTAASNPAQASERKDGRKVDSMIISPTSKMMVVSRNEEALLSRMRDEELENEIKRPTEHVQRPTPPKQVTSRDAPSRRQPAEANAKTSHRILDVSGGDVMAFPTPPTKPTRETRRDRAEPMELSLSKDTLPDQMVLPDVVGHLNSPLLPRSGSVLSPDAASHVSTGFAVSPYTPATGAGRKDYFADETSASHPQELHGSVPTTLTSALRADIERRREQRRGPAMLYATTGLESRQSQLGVEGLEDDEDMASYVRSAVI